MAIGSALYFGAIGCTAALDGDADASGSSGGSSSGTGGSTSSTGGGGNTGGGEVVTLPGGLKLKGRPEYYRVVRLTHPQWENSVRDVLQLDAATGLSTSFISDPPDGKFSNNERALYVTDTLRVDYQRSAETVAESVATDPAKLAKLGPAGDSAAVIAATGKRAFRRDLSEKEQAAFEALWASGATFYASGNAFADGARVFVEALLQSPHFIYRVELSPDGQRLSGAELATKVSFLLRNTTPSDDLLNAAASGALDTDEGLESLVLQMLEETDTRVVAEHFHGELFGLERYKSILKNTTMFPTFSEELNPVLMEADSLFFDYVYAENRGLREILTSDVAFVNADIAGFYGLTSQSPTLTQVVLDGSRPGYFTRVGFLAYNANLSVPDPIHRGVDVNNRILCAELSPPPGEIPPLPDPIPGQTNRQRVTAHTGEGICGNCHNNVINPPGFALETFDAMGQARTMDNGNPIDTTGTLNVLDGMLTFTDITDMTTQLAETNVAHACYAANLAEFAFGRDIGAGESELITALQAASRESDASVKNLLLAMIKSPQFVSARSGAAQ